MFAILQSHPLYGWIGLVASLLIASVSSWSLMGRKGDDAFSIWLRGHTWSRIIVGFAAGAAILLSAIVLSADANPSNIAYQRQNGAWYVRGSVNGHPLEFLVDTGASGLSISNNVARDIQKSAFILGQQGACIRKAVETGNGSAIGCEYPGNHLTIGGWHSIAPVLVMENQVPDAVIGTNVIAACCVMEMNGSSLTMSRPVEFRLIIAAAFFGLLATVSLLHSIALIRRRPEGDRR